MPKTSFPKGLVEYASSTSEPSASPDANSKFRYLSFSCVDEHQILTSDFLETIEIPTQLPLCDFKASHLAATVIHLSTCPISELNPLQKTALAEFQSSSIEYDLTGKVSMERTLEAYARLFDNLFFCGSLLVEDRVHWKLYKKTSTVIDFVAQTWHHLENNTFTIEISEDQRGGSCTEENNMEIIGSLLHEFLHVFLLLHGCLGCMENWVEGDVSGHGEAFLDTMHALYTEAPRLFGRNILGRDSGCLGSLANEVVHDGAPGVEKNMPDEMLERWDVWRPGFVGEVERRRGLEKDQAIQFDELKDKSKKGYTRRGKFRSACMKLLGYCKV
jgi:hypothetical protein